MMGHADDTNELEIGGLTSRSICNHAYTHVCRMSRNPVMNGHESLKTNMKNRLESE